jgi:short-subunit dehydrogenase involved in D-alanine esterification of teichoic acids
MISILSPPMAVLGSAVMTLWLLEKQDAMVIGLQCGLTFNANAAIKNPIYNL